MVRLWSPSTRTKCLARPCSTSLMICQVSTFFGPPTPEMMLVTVTIARTMSNTHVNGPRKSRFTVAFGRDARLPSLVVAGSAGYGKSIPRGRHQRAGTGALPSRALSGGSLQRS